MPDATAIKYTLKEVTAMMIKDQGIKQGHWMLQATYSWAVSNIGSADDGPSGPATISMLVGIGIQQAAKPEGPFTVDAAPLWEKTPARRGRRKAKKASRS